MRPVNLDIPLRGQGFFNHLESSSRKDKPSPLKQPGFFHHGEPYFGMSQVDAGRLGYAINDLFHPSKSSSSTSSWNDPFQCAWYITEALKKYPINTVVKLIDALPCYDNPNDIVVVTLLGTLEEEKLKSALIEGLKSDRIKFQTVAEKFVFKQLGKKIVPDLIKFLEDGNRYARAHAYSVLGFLGKDASDAMEVLATKVKSDRENSQLANNALQAILSDMKK